MSAKQTPMLLGRFVEHQDYFNPLPVKDAQWAIQNPKDAVALCVTAIKRRMNGAPKTERTHHILRPVTLTPAENRTFKADDTFFNKKSGVKMVEHGSNFTSWFTGKVEEDAPEGELRAFMLTESAIDSEIIAELGGEDAVKVTLAEVWNLMKLQANGEKGKLLTDGRASIFYVWDDVNVVLRAVSVCWHDGGWDVDANALGGLRWRDGRQVFSRNS